MVLQNQWDVQLARVEYAVILAAVFDLQEVGVLVLFHFVQVALDRGEAGAQVLALLVLVVDLGAQLEVVPEEVHDDGLVVELEVESTQIAVNEESYLMPALLSLVEWVNQHVAIHRVLGLLGRVEVHSSLDHEERKLAILLQLEVLQGCLLKEKSNQDGCSLYLIGNTRHVRG